MDNSNLDEKIERYLDGAETAKSFVSASPETQKLVADLEKQAQMWQADKATLQKSLVPPSRSQIMQDIASWQRLGNQKPSLIKRSWRGAVLTGLAVAAALALTVILVAILAVGNNPNNPTQKLASSPVVPTVAIAPTWVVAVGTVAAETPAQGVTTTMIVSENTPTNVPATVVPTTTTAAATVTAVPNNVVPVVPVTVAPVEVTLPPPVETPTAPSPTPVPPKKPVAVTVVGKIIAVGNGTLTLAAVSTTYTIKISGNTAITRSGTTASPKVGDLATVSGLADGQIIEATSVVLDVNKGTTPPVGNPTFPDDKK